MTLHQIKILIAIAENLSITKSAARLHMSQPAVSNQLNLLEEEIGLKLHRKSPGGIDLTKEGRVLLRHAKAIVSKMTDFEKEVTALKIASGSRNDRCVSIGGYYGALASLIPRAIGNFNKVHPEVRFNLETDVSSVLESFVLESRLDLAVLIDCSQHSGLVYEPLISETPIIVASKDYPLASTRKLALADLAATPLVMQRKNASGNLTERVLQEFSIKGLKPNIVIWSNSPDATISTATSGIGLAVSLPAFIEPYLERGLFKTFKVPELSHLVVHTFIIYRKKKKLSRDAQEFLLYLRRERGFGKTGWLAHSQLKVRDIRKVKKTKAIYFIN